VNARPKSLPAATKRWRPPWPRLHVATGKPQATLVHISSACSTRQAIYEAWLNSVPYRHRRHGAAGTRRTGGPGSTGSTRPNVRRRSAELCEWDDQPQGALSVAESILRAYQIAMTERRAGLPLPRRRAAREPTTSGVHDSDPSRYRRARCSLGHARHAEAAEALRKRAGPCSWSGLGRTPGGPEALHRSPSFSGFGAGAGRRPSTLESSSAPISAAQRRGSEGCGPGRDRRRQGHSKGAEPAVPEAGSSPPARRRVSAGFGRRYESHTARWSTCRRGFRSADRTRRTPWRAGGMIPASGTGRFSAASMSLTPTVTTGPDPSGLDVGAAEIERMTIRRLKAPPAPAPESREARRAIAALRVPGVRPSPRPGARASALAEALLPASACLRVTGGSSGHAVALGSES